MGMSTRGRNLTTIPRPQRKLLTIKTPDGLAFQGHCSPYSNMYPIEIIDDNGRKASSNEHMFAQIMAEACQADLDLQKQIQETTNPYTINNLMKQIKVNDMWNNNRDKYLGDINLLTFSSHPSLMAKLIEVKRNPYVSPELRMWIWIVASKGNNSNQFQT